MDPETDEWDGNQHRAMMCVGCIVSGWVGQSPTVRTSCGLVIDTRTQQNPDLPKCQDCAKLPDPDVCGFCSDPVNVRWKT